MHSTAFFAQTYAQARNDFRHSVDRAGGRLDALVVSPDGGPAGDELTIDIGTVGNAEAMENQGACVLLTSGLHGVEGFAGSALQRLALELGPPPGVRLILMHALNPYGMAHGRRVNAGNVDLNRNFLGPDEGFFQPADAYRPFHGLLNPDTSRPPLGLDGFLPGALNAILRHGLPTLKQSIVGGQYEFPRGIFFGGARREREVVLIEDALTRLCRGADPLFHIDFHTGLGRRGTHALLLEAAVGSSDLEQARTRWGDRVQPWDAGEGVAYEIRGGLPAAVTRLFGQRATSLTCEFGTFSVLRVLAGLRRENRATQTKSSAREVAASRRALRRLFDPPDPHWRAAVLAGGETVLRRAFALARAEG